MIRKCFFVLILTICNTHAASLTGTVVAVADGDTITVLDSNNRKHRNKRDNHNYPLICSVWSKPLRAHSQYIFWQLERLHLHPSSGIGVINLGFHGHW